MHRVEEHYRCDASQSLYGSEKADDSMPREELWFCMKKSRVAEQYVRVVHEEHKDGEITSGI